MLKPRILRSFNHFGCFKESVEKLRPTLSKLKTLTVSTAVNKSKKSALEIVDGPGLSCFSFEQSYFLK